MIAGFVPTPEIHHGDALLIMFFRRSNSRGRLLSHSLLGDAQMHEGAIGQFFTRAGDALFQEFLSLGKLLLLEVLHSLLIKFQLLLKVWINHLPNGLSVGSNILINFSFQW